MAVVLLRSSNTPSLDRLFSGAEFSPHHRRSFQSHNPYDLRTGDYGSGYNVPSLSVTLGATRVMRLTGMSPITV